MRFVAVFALCQFVGFVLIQVALFVVFTHENGEDQVAVLKEKLLHGRAVVEELLEDSQDLVPILEVSGEPIYVDEDVNNGYVR